ncbi:MAG: type IV secretory system conjugative DNA transfer family protein, partial [Oscillospiraceae bacterium]|nr:type IV secretory system conjugative DNA transfer family protein [Oscillospiraceae bacterium]
MNVRTLKRYVLPNLHYVFLWWLFDKVGEAYRTAYGADKLKKLIGAAAIYLTVLYKKHKKKWRKDIEYGSARWGNKSDIAPYVDPKPDSNIILTAMESLTLNG